MEPRTRVIVELAGLATATVVFLVVFPDRRMGVDVTLALFALALIAANAGYTRRTIWGRFPVADPAAARKRAWRVVMTATGVAVAALAILGAALAWREGGAPATAARFAQPGVLLAFVLYLAWALLQQTLFQFYLLGRLKVVFEQRPSIAIVVTGCAYSLVHLPDLRVTAVTAVAGIFWCYAYDRYHTLVPLAVSHAMLGSTFYYWVYGKDLAARWLDLG